MLLFLYSLLLAFALLLLLPRFVFDALRHGKYAAGFFERAGSVPFIEPDAGRPVIWLHCVSVGETQAARTIIEALRQTYPHARLVISTTTLTGQRTAQELYSHQAAHIIYFPFDFAWTVRRALKRINPCCVLIMETEIWARFLYECYRRQIPTAILNGRISPRSIRGYKRIRFFMRPVLKTLTLAVMQTEADAARLQSLGLDPARIVVSGNVKFDVAAAAAAGDKGLTEDLQIKQAQLKSRFGLDSPYISHLASTRPLIVAASTHHPEEKIALAAFIKILEQANASNSKDASTFASVDKAKVLRSRLLIAPRHPERFAEVAALCAQVVNHTNNNSTFNRLTFARRSAVSSNADASADIILLDSIGELALMYSFAQIVFVGGSIAPHGGHNILEPAAAHAAVITGAHTANFAAIIESFKQAAALIQLPPTTSGTQATESLARAFNDLLSNAKLCQSLTDNAARTLAANRGATARTLKAVAERIKVEGRK